jgi:NAD(P)-dependent dehydrogenase (short-subunit alcohol dehydrogenase family)
VTRRFAKQTQEASTTALNAFTIYLADELLDMRVKVNSADPGHPFIRNWVEVVKIGRMQSTRVEPR